MTREKKTGGEKEGKKREGKGEGREKREGKERKKKNKKRKRREERGVNSGRGRIDVSRSNQSHGQKFNFVTNPHCGSSQWRSALYIYLKKKFILNTSMS
ncbi:unnamed protein product [Prunus armeniaca]|uniref:Uncharacterized protein n=1 Tax=Prunus armeniaca TaxID=36596 RepID=A0A6J5TIG4_PRUAR|nr:unnamed protein product [Prunus armeniaca]